jgi:cytochrome P450
VGSEVRLSKTRTENSISDEESDMAVAATDTERVEIDFSIFNPFDPEYVTDPFPVVDRMLTQYPVAFHTGMNLWLVSPHDLADQVMRDARFSTRYEDWNDAPAPVPQEHWTLYDRCMAQSMLNTQPADHQRLRRLTAPAFSRRVMDQIEEKIRDNIIGIFDEIDDPTLFNFATDVAAKVPIRAIARMVGVPPDAEDLFEHGLGWNMVRATNPMYAAERDTLVQNSLPGLRYLHDTIVERRDREDPGDDFIGTLVGTEIDGERLSDMDILALIVALVVAGADTAIDLHSMAIKALLEHPDQRQLLRDRPELMLSAVVEILRWSGFSKLGGMPRFPMEDIELGGQVLTKGSLVFTLHAPSWRDPEKWPDTGRFDITRNHAGHIVFGAGPHLCIGMHLVQVQAKLMIQEFERRFGDSARIVGDIEYDPMHFNSRRVTTMMIGTGAS